MGQAARNEKNISSGLCWGEELRLLSTTSVSCISASRKEREERRLAQLETSDWEGR